jgi:hypothetical protein
MSAEQLAERIEKLPPDKRALVERLIDALGELPPRADVVAQDAEDVGILRHIGKYQLGQIIGRLTAEELHEDD